MVSFFLCFDPSDFLRVYSPHVQPSKLVLVIAQGSGSVAQSFVVGCRYKYLCPVLASFEDTANMYLVQEYCQKGDVLQMLEDAGGRLKEEEAAKQVRATSVSPWR